MKFTSVPSKVSFVPSLIRVPHIFHSWCKQFPPALFGRDRSRYRLIVFVILHCRYIRDRWRNELYSSEPIAKNSNWTSVDSCGLIIVNLPQISYTNFPQHWIKLQNIRIQASNQRGARVPTQSKTYLNKSTPLHRIHRVDKVSRKKLIRIVLFRGLVKM